MNLTCARAVEALGAKWDEIDLAKKLWTIPAPRMKSNRQHIVPLSELAVRVLEQRLKVRTGDFVFSGPVGRPVSHTYFALAPGRLGLDLAAPHSWRSIWRDWAGDIGRIDFDLAEAAIAHALSATVRAYRRETAIDARRGPMERYSHWLAGDAEDNIVAFPKRA